MKATQKENILYAAGIALGAAALFGGAASAEAQVYNQQYQYHGQGYNAPAMQMPFFVPIFEEEKVHYPDPMYYPPSVSYTVDPVVTYRVPERFWNPYYYYYQTETAASGYRPPQQYPYPYQYGYGQASSYGQPAQYQYQQQYQQQYQYQYQQQYQPAPVRKTYAKPCCQPAYTPPVCCYYGKQ